MELKNSGMQARFQLDVDKVPNYDPRSGNHYWIVGLTFRVDPTTWEPGGSVHFDLENLVLAVGPGCFYCEQNYDKRLVMRRCKGQPS